MACSGQDSFAVTKGWKSYEFAETGIAALSSFSIRKSSLVEVVKLELVEGVSFHCTSFFYLKFIIITLVVGAFRQVQYFHG